MTYTQAIGRQFWLTFDDHFKFESGSNGLAQRYASMGGYNGPSRAWVAARSGGNFPSDFENYVAANEDTVIFLAKEQKSFFDQNFTDGLPDIILAMQDFAFGVLASPNGLNRQNEPVHTMNGGLNAVDYLSWHGFIEAAIVAKADVDFWTEFRWVNGMAWELQVKSRPQEIPPNQNEPLSQVVTAAIHHK